MRMESGNSPEGERTGEGGGSEIDHAGDVVVGDINGAPEMSESSMREIGNGEKRDSDPLIGEKGSKTLVTDGRTRKVEDGPPVDDCCSICFGNFTIPCKTSCGHWFCASCILQFWNHRAALRQCKCPICCCLISKLTPEASLLTRNEEEVIMVLKNIQRYNRLFLGGPRGLMMRVLELPLVIWRIICRLLDPERLRDRCYSTRFAAVVLCFLYNLSLTDLILTGSISRVLCAVAFAVIICLIVVAMSHIHQRRERARGTPRA